MAAIRSQMARSGVVSTSTLQPRGEGGGDNVSASQRVQEVRLVMTATQSDADRRSLQEVYEFMKSQSSVTHVQWLEEGEVLSRPTQQQNDNKRYVYVMYPFSGAAFDVLKQAGAPVFSPQCVLFNIRQGLSLPRNRGCPIACTAMMRVHACCSNMSAEARDEMFKNVEEMAGSMSKALTAFCTHLITPVVGSTKYFAAKVAGKKVVLPGWVEAVYTLGMRTGLDYSDDVALASQYATPIFAGCYVSVSQLTHEQRTQIKALMREHGGRYDKDLTKATVTHLICDVVAGDKCIAAMGWKIPVVRTQWIHDSVQQGYCLDWKKYLLVGPRAGDATGVVSDNRVDSSSGSRTSQRPLTPDHVRQGPNGVRATSTPNKNAQRLDMELDISAIDRQVKVEEGVQVKKEVLQAIAENEDVSAEARPVMAVLAEAMNTVSVQQQPVADENGVSTTDGFLRPSPKSSSSPHVQVTVSAPVVKVEPVEVKPQIVEKVEAVPASSTTSLAQRVKAALAVQENQVAATSALSLCSKTTPTSSQNSAADVSTSAPTGSNEIAQLRDQLKMAKVSATGKNAMVGRLQRRPSKGKKSPGRKDRGHVTWSQQERHPFSEKERGQLKQEDEEEVRNREDTEEEYDEGSDNDIEEIPIINPPTVKAFPPTVKAVPPTVQAVPPTVKPLPTVATTNTTSIVPLLRQTPAVAPTNKKTPAQQEKKIEEAVQAARQKRPVEDIQVVDLEEEEVKKGQKVFMLSGINGDAEKALLFDAIEAMGGEYIDSIQLNPQATHLLVKTPTKNEKYYGCCATGKFILHPSYILDSLKSRRYLPEEQYEWGNVEKASHLLLNLDDNNIKLAKAAHRWRVQISKGRLPAFTGWSVIVVAESQVRGDGYIRMLRAGGATIIPNTPPLLQYVKRATHLLYEAGKAAPTQEVIEEFEDEGVICRRPEALSLYITDHTVDMIPAHLRKANSTDALPPVKRSRL